MGTVTTIVQTDAALAFLEAVVSEALITSLGMMLGQKVTAEKLRDVNSTPSTKWFRQSFSPDAIGSVDFGIETHPAVALGQKILSASGLNGEDDEAALGSITEILAQVGSTIASSMTSRLKREIAALALTSAQSSALTAVGIRLVFKDGDNVSLVVCPSPSLATSLSLSSPNDLVPVAATAAPPRNIDLLLDVKVPVSVSFGRIQLPLRDVIKLTSGSIVDLRRAVSEPLDIILNDSVVARGEVVVIEGTFGVRIKQIISKQERLHSVS